MANIYSDMCNKLRDQRAAILHRCAQGLEERPQMYVVVKPGSCQSSYKTLNTRGARNRIN